MAEGIDELTVYPSQTAEYLAALESSGLGKREPRHLLVFDKGELVLFAPCYLQISSEYDDLTRTLASPRIRRLVDLAANLRILSRLEPALVCSSPEAFYTVMSTGIKDPEERKHAALTMLGGLEELASAEGIELLAFLNVPSREETLWNLLPVKGYEGFVRDQSTHLDITWSDFDEYLHSFSRSRRKSYNSEINRETRYGLNIREITGFESIKESLSEVASEMWGVRGKESPFTPSYYESMARWMRGKASILAGYEGEKLQGFTLLFWHRDHMCAYQYSGRPNQFVRSSNLYFNICYNRTIDKAISMGMKWIRYGPGTLKVKIRRGCSLEDIGIFLKPLRKVHLPAIKILVAHNRRTRSRLDSGS